MASNAKIALMVAMFAFMATMAMAVHAGNHTVSCTNKYCKPITVNGVVIGVGLTAGVLFDNILRTLTIAVPDLLRNEVIFSCGLPLGVTGVAVLEQGVDLEVEVTAGTMISVLGSICCKSPLDPPYCLL